MKRIKFQEWKIPHQTEMKLYHSELCSAVNRVTSKMHMKLYHLEILYPILSIRVLRSSSGFSCSSSESELSRWRVLA